MTLNFKLYAIFPKNIYANNILLFMSSLGSGTSLKILYISHWTALSNKQNNCIANFFSLVYWSFFLMFRMPVAHLPIELSKNSLTKKFTCTVHKYSVYGILSYWSMEGSRGIFSSWLARIENSSHFIWKFLRGTFSFTNSRTADS